MALISGALALGALQGCAVNRDNTYVSPDVDLLRLKKLHVVKLDADEHAVNNIIARELTKLGFEASTGLGASAPKDADALVTYQDRWQWDMTMYMIELKIQVREPRTGGLLAMGDSFHTSLTRKSPEEMAAGVLSNIFKGAAKAP